MRCFVAAFVEADSARPLQQAYAAWCQGQRGAPRRLRAVPVENYHVTLKFLGEVEQQALPEVLGAVAELEGVATSAAVRAFTGLPRPSLSRAAVAELAPHELIFAWWAALQRSLGAEDRPLRPHVTMARAVRPQRLAPASLEEPLPLSLLAPCLYRSDPTPRGQRYRPVGNLSGP